MNIQQPQFVDGRSLAVDLQTPANAIAGGLTRMFDNQRQEQQAMAKQAQEQERQRQMQNMQDTYTDLYAIKSLAPEKRGAFINQRKAEYEASGDPESARQLAKLEAYMSQGNIDSFLDPQIAVLKSQLGIKDGGESGKDATTSKTIVYKDGSYQVVMNDGSRRVYDGEDILQQGEDAKNTIRGGVKSGIQSAIDQSVGIASAQTTANDKNTIMKQGRAAQQMIPQTQELLRLNQMISTSGFTANKKAVADFFGITNPDEGLFNAKAGKLILDNIRALGANPTEGERAFLERITPSLKQGAQVNDAILQDMLDIQQRQVDRARWLYNNPSANINDYFFSQDVDDFKSNNNPDAKPKKTSITGKDRQAGNQININDIDNMTEAELDAFLAQ